MHDEVNEFKFACFISYGVTEICENSTKSESILLLQIWKKENSLKFSQSKSLRICARLSR
jgi:hypothetical protein